jgi:hypothetical protein
MEKLVAYAHTLATWIKVRRSSTLGLSVALATAIYIWDPTNKAHINVAGATLALELPSFNNCDLYLHNPVRIGSYSVGVKTGPAPLPAGSTASLLEVPVNHTVAVLTVTNPASKQPGFLRDPSQVYLVHISSADAESIGIDAVTIDGQKVPLKSFLEKNVRSQQATLVRGRYIRQAIARAIYNMNDWVSNFILTAMVFYISVLMAQVGILEFTTYFHPTHGFTKILRRCGDSMDANERQRALAIFEADWLKRDSAFQHRQLLGPALGFILTVSSLVAALYPSSMGNNMEGFLAGIHVALISTFLGLFMRLVALEGARVNDKLGELFEGHLESIAAKAQPSGAPQPIGAAAVTASDTPATPSASSDNPGNGPENVTKSSNLAAAPAKVVLNPPNATPGPDPACAEVSPRDTVPASPVKAAPCQPRIPQNPPENPLPPGRLDQS